MQQRHVIPRSGTQVEYILVPPLCYAIFGLMLS
jgi:hypothetical protein